MRWWVVLLVALCGGCDGRFFSFRRSAALSSRVPQLHLQPLHSTAEAMTSPAAASTSLSAVSESPPFFIPAFWASLAPFTSTWAARTATGAFLAATWTPLCFAGKPTFGLALAGPVALAVSEFHRLLDSTGGLSSEGVGVCVASSLLACVLATHAPHFHAFTLPLSVTALLFRVLLLKKSLTSSGAVTGAAFSATYLSFFLSFWIRQLDISVVKFVNLSNRKMGPLTVTDGALLLWWTHLIIASADVGGYVFGKLFGRHPVAQLGVAAGSASPKKTLEGLLGGVVLAVASALAGVLLFRPELPWQVEGLTSYAGLGYRFALLYGTSLALLSFVSDVSVSLFKRNAGVKDTGRVLPGHGGVLDRLDSYILTAPAVYMFWSLVANACIFEQSASKELA